MSQSGPQPGNSPAKKNNTIIFFVIIIILAVACVYLFVSKNQMENRDNVTLKMEKQQTDSVNALRTSLQSDFDAASAKIDQLVTQNAKADSALQSNKAEMEKLRGRISGILRNEKATQNELKEARDMIASLNDKGKEYEARIAELEKENGVLTSKNTVLTHERDSTVTKNIALKKLGSVLHASNIRMEPIHKRKNGKEKETSKAKRVDVLRIKFDIDENRIAESGTKQLYIRMIAPDQSILGNPANTSGMMSLASGGQLGYSMMKEIPLTTGQMVKDIDVDWNQNGDYQRGDYAIEIYNDGYKIGGGKVTLK